MFQSGAEKSRMRQIHVDRSLYLTSLLKRLMVMLCLRRGHERRSSSA